MKKISCQFCFGSLLNLVAVNIFIFQADIDYKTVSVLITLVISFFIMRSYMIYVFNPDENISLGYVISLGSLVFAVSSLIEATIIFSLTRNIHDAILFAFCMFFSETYPLLEKIYVGRKYQISQIAAHGIYIFHVLVIVCIITAMILSPANYLELYLLLAAISCVIDFVLISLPSGK